jgi:hypothetical protein
MNNERDDGKKYFGWANQETWLVKLWLDHDRESCLYRAVEARKWSGGKDAAIEFAKELKEQIEGGVPTLEFGLYADLLNAAIAEVEWYEIAKAFLAEAAEECTGQPSVCNAPPMPSKAPEEQRHGEPEKPKSEPDESDLEDFFGPVISRYTRAQAIEDGVLVDVSETAKEAGFKIPVALTHGVWEKYVEVPDGVSCQDEAGRLWDVLFMCHYGISRGKGEESETLFQLHVRNDNREGEPPLVTLKAVCGPADDASPCITIMLPDED